MGSDVIGEDDQPSLEFVASGTGIFSVPNRPTFHPERPPYLELRPHPLRETQLRTFLRTIACTESQLWAGQESGVRVWNLSDAHKPGSGTDGQARRGDQDAAPFYESRSISPTMCLIIDSSCKLVWSGHKDGMIRSWNMDQTIYDNPFKEGCLAWQAHAGSVLCMAISSYGDLWSGSEGGVIKIWPWDAIEKSLSVSPEERHMTASLVERSGIDIRSQVTVNGVCNISSSDVRSLLADNARAKVWAAGALSFSLWDARSRELLKVYNVDGQIENIIDMPSLTHDQPVEDELNVKFVSKSRKDKSKRNSILQCSRNAIMVAADAVLRVATKGAVVEDAKRTEALILTADGMIWSGCANGVLVQWDGNGNRLKNFHHHPCAVKCFCTLGTRIWVGYVNGMVQLLDLEGNLIAGWVAHNGPVIKLAIGFGYVFSLANHGGIRGWNISSPGSHDNILRLELARKEHMYTRRENIRILIGTWNVGERKGSNEALMTWLGSAANDAGIVVVGCQEVDMGAGFLAMSVAREAVGEGSSIGKWWQDALGKALNEGTTFERVGSRELAGLVIAIWVRKTLRPHVGDLDVAAVACGLGRVIGNKGGVGLRLRVYDRVLCFVNCHLAAHLEAVNHRNADFDHIYRTMIFTQSPNFLKSAAGIKNLFLFCSLAFPMFLCWLLYSSGFPFLLAVAAGVSTAVQMLRATNALWNATNEERPDLAEADLVVFLGDFNYRLFGISYDETRHLVSQRSFDWLLEKDQLRAEMKAGKVFQGMHEAHIRFPPTYKFDKRKQGLEGYDSGKKKRIPSWCDRVLYRDNRPSSTAECNLECPVVASVLQYEACMDVIGSDHKPVRCKLNVEIAHVDRSVRRQEMGHIVKHNEDIRVLLEQLKSVPETVVSVTSIALQNHEAFTLRLTNRSGNDCATFQIECEGQSIVVEKEKRRDYRPRGSFGFPRWLKVMPAAGLLGVEQVVDISVAHEESQEEVDDDADRGWWSEDSSTGDKELVLLVNVRGSCSTETMSHRIIVRHSFS